MTKMIEISNQILLYTNLTKNTKIGVRSLGVKNISLLKHTFRCSLQILNYCLIMNILLMTRFKFLKNL